jgi:sulfide dehydrogenase cytochrome subunit
MHTLRALITARGAALNLAFTFTFTFTLMSPAPALAADATPAGAAACSGCHAAASGVASPVPRLIGLDAPLIVQAMQAFRAGTRSATVMDRIAKGFNDAEIQAIAEWYARQR